MRIFLDDLSWNWWTEAEYLLQCGWASSIPLKDSIKQNTEKKGIHPFLLPMAWAGTFISSSPVPRIHTISSLLQRVMDLDWVTPLAFQACHLQGCISYWFCFSGKLWWIHCSSSTRKSMIIWCSSFSARQKWHSSQACKYVSMRKQGWFLFNYEIRSKNFINIFKVTLYNLYL